MNEAINNGTKQNCRIDWLDLAKGIGILCVVFGHTQIPYFSEFFIYPFHVPLFFILSGFCFKIKENETFLIFLINKVKTLLVPYTFFSFIWIIYECVNKAINDGINVRFVLAEFYMYLKQDHLHAIWFITCIFVLKLIAYFIVKYCNYKNPILVLVAMGFVVLTIIYKAYVDIQLPWNVEIVLPAMPFFLSGYLLKQNKKLFDIAFNFKYVLLYFLTYISIGAINFIVFDGNNIDMYSGRYGNIFLFYIAAILGSAFVIGLSIKLSKICFVNYIGKNSLIIFSLHQIVFYIVRDIFNNVTNTIMFLLVELSCFVVSISVCCLFNELIKKTHLAFFINGCKVREE